MRQCQIVNENIRVNRASIEIFREVVLPVFFWLSVNL